MRGAAWWILHWTNPELVSSLRELATTTFYLLLEFWWKGFCSKSETGLKVAETCLDVVSLVLSAEYFIYLSSMDFVDRFVT